MNKTVNAALTKIAIETLEKLAFMFPMADERGSGPAPGKITRVAVSFEGPFCGRLLMEISRALLPELAGNMLGVDSMDVTDEQQNDAIAETANIICGNLLPAIGGSRMVFEIGAPEVFTDENVPVSSARAVATVKLAVEGQPCDLQLFVDGRLPGESD